jgi:hypothetical protein
VIARFESLSAPQRPEERSHLIGERLRLLQRGEMAAARHDTRAGLAPLSPCGPSLILGVELPLDAFFAAKSEAFGEGPRVRTRLPPAASPRESDFLAGFLNNGREPARYEH